jgi:hypothetical protein
MTRKIAGMIAAVGIMGAAVATAHPVQAGSQWNGAYVSSTYRYAYGTFAGFRNNSDPNAYVDFSTYVSPAGDFYGGLNGTYVSCAVPSGNAALVAAFNQVLQDRDYFYISWDASGNCNFIAVSNSSEYGSY